MKSICVVCLLLVRLFCSGQSSVKPFLLSVTTGKTTTLIFPFPIKQVDRGIPTILVQKSPGMENVLLVKASGSNFPETNLTVFTTDGKLYPFLVRYAADPEVLNYSFADSLQNPLSNDALLKEDAELAAKQRGFLHRTVRSYEMVFSLKGIYLKDHVLWFCLRVSNNSVIDFVPEGWRSFIRNKRTAKRTAVQEIDKYPVYQSVLSVVEGNGSKNYVLGFSSFTMDRSEELVIGFREHEGERVLYLPVGSKKLLRARNIQ